MLLKVFPMDGGRCWRSCGFPGHLHCCEELCGYLKRHWTLKTKWGVLETASWTWTQCPWVSIITQTLALALFDLFETQSLYISKKGNKTYSIEGWENMCKMTTLSSSSVSDNHWHYWEIQTLPLNVHYLPVYLMVLTA
jgi:hypothetical protein